MAKKPPAKFVAIHDSSGEFLAYADANIADFLGEHSDGTIFFGTTTQLYRFPDDRFCFRIATIDGDDLNVNVIWQLTTPTRAAHWFVTNNVREGKVPECLLAVVQSRLIDEDGESRGSFSLLDRFPATSVGHVAFLELVRDEVHQAAEAKRNQFAEKYPNAIIEKMVRSVHWPEAGARLAAIPDLSTDVVEQVARVVRRELTPGTVERIDELLTPAVVALRDAWENRTLGQTGEAFRHMMETDPETRPPWEQARGRLQAFARAMQAEMASPEYKAAQETERQRWRELSDAIRTNMELMGIELAGRHFTRPETIEDWEHLARIIEIPAETNGAGNLNAGDILACALAWADRQTTKAKLTGETKVEAVKGESEIQPALHAPIKFPSGWMGDMELATAFGVHTSHIPAFRAKLKRMRDKDELSFDDWKEFENRKRNEPQFLYRANAPAIVAMAKRYTLPK